jgi:hypothetical protein
MLTRRSFFGLLLAAVGAHTCGLLPTKCGQLRIHRLLTIRDADRLLGPALTPAEIDRWLAPAARNFADGIDRYLAAQFDPSPSSASIVGT